MAKRPYDSLNDWMERNRVNGNLLRAMLREEKGVSISAGHLSNILSGSRRCSLKLALALHELTDVPIKALAEWPVRNSRISRSAA